LRDTLQQTQRLVAIWRQQPENTAALESTLKRVDRGVAELKSPKPGEIAPATTNVDPATLSIIDTYRRTGPVDGLAAAARAAITNNPIDRIATKAAELNTLLQRQTRDRHAEAVVIQDLDRILSDYNN
jgi:hypothetical protein